MHPAIRFTSFFVIVFALAVGGRAALVCSILLLPVAWIITRRIATVQTWKLVLRMRWLFVSILVLYGYFTPGETWFGGDIPGMPSQLGSLIALEKIALLVSIVLWVSVWFGNLTQDQWLIGIDACLKPISVFGIDRDRWLIRISLTLNELSNLHAHITKSSDAPTRSKGKNGISEIAAAAARHFSDTVEKPIRVSEVFIPSGGKPSWREWMIPVVIAAVFVFTHTAANSI